MIDISFSLMQIYTFASEKSNKFKMSEDIRLKKGLNIPMLGEAEQVYSTTEEPWEYLRETKVFNNLEEVGEILWTESYKDGILLNSTETF